jgi:hypothetical protein
MTDLAPRKWRKRERFATLTEDQLHEAATEWTLRNGKNSVWYKAWWFLGRPIWKPVVAGLILGLAHFLLNMYTAYPRIPPYDKIAKWDQNVEQSDKVQKANEDRDREMRADIASIKLDVATTKSDAAATKAQVGFLYDRERAREAHAQAMMSGPESVADNGKH